MGTPRVLILGHSFIRRLCQFIEQNSPDLNKKMNIAEPMTSMWHGVGVRTVEKTIRHDMHTVESFAPNIVILQLGTNDLTCHSPVQVGSEIEELVLRLHDFYGVKWVCVCQTIRRDGADRFNKDVHILTKYLRVVLEPLPYAIYWGHRGFWKSSNDFYTRDGVHLNNTCLSLHCFFLGPE